MSNSIFIPRFWNNPELQEINRLPARSPLPPFSSIKDAVAYAAGGPEANCIADNPLHLALDGEWDFLFLENPDADFPLSPDSRCTKIRVPGTWTLQGYDKPHYTNVQMPFNKLPPETPEKNPTGIYYRTFSLPDGWSKKRVVLHVGSAESAVLVFANGKFVGAGKDTRLPSEFDLTAFLTDGTNTLCLQVVRYSDASYVEDQDQWWFGGIHRSVFLYCTEKQYIADITALPSAPEKTDGNAAGTLRLAVAVGGAERAGNAQGNAANQEAGDAFNIEYAVYELNPARLPADKAQAVAFADSAKAKAHGSINFECNYRVNSCSAEFSVEVQNPVLWSHENPALYVIAVTLKKEGRELESTAFCTGFRKVEIAARELRINGKMVYIKGVNRHEHNDRHGKTLTTEEMKRDIFLLKAHNFNAVRTCHYPDDERWYELCDRYGIYLTDEANIENHCFYDQLCRDARWSYAYAVRVQRMFLRDKNHPSVIVWSLGNESGDGPNQTACGAWLRKADGTRPIHYEGFIRPERGQGDFTLDSLARGKGLTDIIGPMYPSIDLIVEYVRTRDDNRPLIMCEYTHAMGNSNGSLSDYWQAIKTNKGLQGGYIWDWIDQGIAAEKDGEPFWKYGGDFGDEPSDYDFCLNGILFPDQTPKPVMQECKQIFAPVSAAPLPENKFRWRIKNEFDFSTLDKLNAEWRILHEGEVLARGTLALPAAKPGESADIEIPDARKITERLAALEGLTWIQLNFKLKEKTFWTDADHTVKTEECILKESDAEDFLRATAHTAHTAHSDRTSRKVTELSEIARLFSPCLFRAPTENDGLKTYFHLAGDPQAKFYWENKAAIPWLEMDLLHMEIKDTEAEHKDNSCATRRRAELFNGKNATEKYAGKKLGVFVFETAPFPLPDGTPCVKCRAVFDLAQDVPELPRVGLEARIPAAFHTVEWLGRGFCESYSDRKTGAPLGLFRAKIHEMEVPYVLPQTNGNRTDVRSLSLKSDNETIAIRIKSTAQFSALRHTEEMLLNAMHTCDLKDTRENGNGFWTLHLDCANRGVGTGACGPDTLEQYRVRPGLYETEFYLYSRKQ